MNTKQILFWVTIGYLLVQQPLFGYWAAYNSTYTDKTCENLIEHAIKKLNLPKNKKSKQHITPTLAYLDRKGLKEKINGFSTQIKNIGTAYFEQLFQDILTREYEHSKNYQVFYHGQMRDFMLPQDVYTGLYKILKKKLLHHFIILRNKDKELEQFSCAKDFIQHFTSNGEFTAPTWNDTHDHIKKHIMPLNVSLFGNTEFQNGECSFGFFISSSNITSLNQVDFVEHIFKRFAYQDYFPSYKKDIEELSTLLADNEPTKTGMLLQLFIPKNLVDKVVYRSYPFGIPYHGNKLEKHSLSSELDDYKKTKHTVNNATLDQFQCRLLTNPVLVNPNKGVKVFRYCNETACVKSYQNKLNALLDNVAQKKMVVIA